MEKEAVDRTQLVFRIWDADGNGHLDAADFDLVADRVRKIATRSTDAEMRAAEAALQRFWITFSSEMDANQDGKITLDEWTNGTLTPSFFSATVANFADVFPRLGDPDGDGLVDRALFVDLLLAVGFERARIDALYDALEVDGSEQIRVQDWHAAIIEFFDPATVQTAGNHLVPSGTT